MAFPDTPRELSVEMYLNGAWVDLYPLEHVRVGDTGISITRGRRNEAGGSEPTACTLVLDNTTLDYSPRNPAGAYWGSWGLGTPCRICAILERDAFARTSVDSWGSADLGGAWTSTGAGGVVAAANFQVNGGVGKHSVPATNAYRFSYLAAMAHRLVDVRVDVTLPFTDVTGAQVEPANILLRGQTTNRYYMVRVAITTAEAVTVQLMYRAESGTIANLTSAITITGLTHSSSQALRIRAQAEGHTLRAKVWAATAAEPYDWHATANTRDITAAGWVGIRSGVATGNSNALPIVVGYDNLVIRSPRAAGEVAVIAPGWDETENNEWVDVEVAGVRHRLGQGATPLQSTLYRGHVTLATPPIGYWPCEDGEDSASLGSAVGGTPMYVAGPTAFAAYELPASSPLPVVGAATWVGSLPDYTSTGQVQLRFIGHIPPAGVENDSVIADVHTAIAGGILKWEVKYAAGGGGGLSVEIWENSTQLHDSGPVGFTVDDKNIMYSMAMTQNGANIDWTLGTLEVGAAIGLLWNGTLAGKTLGKALRTTVSPYGTLIDTAIGHVSVRKEVTNLFDLSAELKAFTGETALVRLARLCSQHDIPFSYVGAPAATALMGPQRPRKLLDLLQECEDADQGSLYEPRGEIGLAYRQVAATYNQTAAMTQSYAGGQVAPPFRPVDDNQRVRNDVTVNRVDGAYARSVLETGRLSVLSPQDGGAGRYDTSLSVNVYSDDQVAGIAGWVRHRGTVDESRYPAVKTNLASTEVVADATLSQAALSLDIDDRFDVTSPKVGLTPNTISQVAQGIAEQIKNHEHWIIAQAAPESPYRVARLNDGLSKLSTSKSTMAAAITTTSQTSLSVATSSGAVWQTGAVSIPITIGGEGMTVTNITGATSPQTFTVTRSVNGVQKTHLSGVPVVLTRSAILAL